MVTGTVTKNAEKHKLDKISWKTFYHQLKQNYAIFFLYFFFLWIVYFLYKLILSLLGVYGLIATLSSPASVIFVIALFNLPVLYMFFVLSIYFLKRMYFPSLKPKDYFYLGLKLSILNIVFILIIDFIGYLFMQYTSPLALVLLLLVLLLMLFFVFVSYKTVFMDTFAESFSSIFKQLGNIRAIGFFFLTILILGLVFLIVYGLVYLGILPSEIYMLAYPFMMFIMFYMAHHSVRT